jgi:hypothetical protein
LDKSPFGAVVDELPSTAGGGDRLLEELKALSADELDPLI